MIPSCLEKCKPFNLPLDLILVKFRYYLSDGEEKLLKIVLISKRSGTSILSGFMQNSSYAWCFASLSINKQNYKQMENDGYLPVDPDFFNILDDVIEKGHARIHFFNKSNEVDSTEGTLNKLWTPDGFSWFLILLGDTSVRIDRIITLNGRPGPAYDEYDRFALECLTCMGGMD